MKFWLSHPACPEPVSLRRKLAFEVGEWLEQLGRQLSRWAIDPDPDDEIPF